MNLRLRRELHTDGYTDAEIRRALRAGRLCAVRRGAYLAGPAPGDPVARHLAEVRAAAVALCPDAVVSHVSAALVHGLPVWAVPLDRVCVTRPRRRSGARIGARVHVRCAPLDTADVVERDGIAVTSPTRTLLDVARTVPFEQAVVIVDAALRVGLVDHGALAAELERRRRWPGGPAAGRAFAFADGRSDNPGESRSRVAIAAAGLPPPQLQWEVRTNGGVLLGIADFGWKRHRTVGEFDGRRKYGRDLRPGQEPGDAVFAEKLREDALRAEGLAVVRWTWTDLDHFAPVAERIRARLAGR
ncbi:MAG: hypothetical protein AB7J32_07405 [Pseudonocardia sp.]